MEVILGAVIAILITIMVENLRKPKLVLHIASPVDLEYEGRPAKKARYLLVGVENKPLPWFAGWMSRSAALQCHGFITFHHLDGQSVFGRSMNARWSGSTEPIPIQFVLGEQSGIIIDPTRFNVNSRVDIYPDETMRLDIAARFDNEDDSYGWSNESYLSNPVWRNQDWKIPRGRYLINVTVVCSGERCAGLFRLVTDVVQKDFRLEQPMSGDRIREV